MPTFYYGGEPYSRIGVVSNGYIVIGGGTGADIDFPPQTFPNPARPNNVSLRSGRDLNPASGGAVRVGHAQRRRRHLDRRRLGARAGTSATPTTHTVRDLAPLTAAPRPGPEEQITISYADRCERRPRRRRLRRYNWGAENRDGTSGKNIASAPANGREYSVNTAPPIPGGSATIPYDASSKKARHVPTRTRR